MKRATFTLISGDQFFSHPGITVYLKSLINHVSGEKFVFAHNLSLENMKKIAAFGINVVPVPLDMIRLNTICGIWVYRWRVFYNFLAQTRELEHVLITDAKDVLFQGDPFDHPVFCKNDFLQLVGEGQTHEQSQWNCQDQMKFQMELEEAHNFLDWSVANGGVQAGSNQMLQQLGLAIYAGMPLIQYKSSDQAYLNYLYQTYLQADPRVGLSEPDQDWLCLTGETLKWGANRFPMEFRAGTFTNPELARPYAIVHQWERTEFANRIFEVYK